MLVEMDDFKPLGSCEIRKQVMTPITGDLTLQGEMVSICSFSGLIAGTELEREILRPDQRPMVKIYNPNGQLISEQRWNSGRIVSLFWSVEKEILNIVTENGKLLQYDIFLKLQRQISICNEEILEVATFLDGDGKGLGLAILSTSGAFSVLPCYDNATKIREFGELSPQLPECWTVVTRQGVKFLVICCGPNIISTPIDGSSRSETIQCQMSQNFNHLTSISTSIDGSVCVASADVGIQLIIECESMTVVTELNTSAKIKQPPIQTAIVQSKPTAIAALLWNHMLVLLDTDKNWVLFDINQASVIHAEVDGMRLVSTSYHQFISISQAATKGVYAPSGPGALLVDAFDFLMKEDERGEEIISALRDSQSGNALLPDAVVQCTTAATFEFNIQKQKQFLRAASFGKALTDDVESDSFARTNRIMRVLNQIRAAPGIMITINQFKHIGFIPLIDRLMKRNLYKLAWSIATHLQLSEQYPKLKSEIISAWARNLVREVADDTNNETITNRIAARVDKLACTVSFIDIAVEAAELGKMSLAFALLTFEPRFRPKVELLLKIDRTGEKALQSAVESHDPDLIYLALLHIHSKCSQDEYRDILRRYPTAAAQYTIYCKQYNRKMLEELHDPQSRTYHLAMTHLQQATSTSDVTDKLSSLDNASKAFKMNGNCDYAVRAVDAQRQLLERQKALEEQYPDERWTGRSVKETIKLVLLQNDAQMANRLKKEFKFNDRYFFRLRLTCLAQQNQFEEIEQLVRAKKPLIGFDQIIKICVVHGRTDEAEKYLPRCQGKVRINALLNLRRFVLAAEVADQINDVELIGKCYKTAQQFDMTAANEISQRYAN